ncbi:hypothetical protein HMPREF1981_03464 [Bacteroides pyogenes F0041]|uniref:Uncharacterized protein n=1 Tax=Bacteroides pyogenes F0041 TaxID=1321819 RepID=U2DN02_9BACE|nr:hypothetical protein HMPREF1981_03464 [Bacteroides pyogenes F0041]
MILFVIIRYLIFRLAKVVFLCLQKKFRSIFFCLATEKHGFLITFVENLMSVQ